MLFMPATFASNQTPSCCELTHILSHNCRNHRSFKSQQGLNKSPCPRQPGWPRYVWCQCNSKWLFSLSLQVHVFQHSPWPNVAGKAMSIFHLLVKLSSKSLLWQMFVLCSWTRFLKFNHCYCVANTECTALAFLFAWGVCIYICI